MEVPSPSAGVVKSLQVKVGDKISQGNVILTLENNVATVVSAEKPVATAATSSNKSTAPDLVPAPAQVSAPSAKAFTKGDLHAEVLVVGAGPGGYTAAFRAADLGKQVVLMRNIPS